MSSPAQRRLVFGAVLTLSGIVVLLGVRQLLGVIDQLNVLVVAFLVLGVTATLSASQGERPPRRR